MSSEVKIPNEPIRAYLPDGREVDLRSDGTWRIRSRPVVDSVHFRNARWGMSREEVLATEPGPPESDDAKCLTYSDLVMAMPCKVLYLFAKNQLVRGKYIFTHEHLTDSKFESDYESLGGILCKKYGDPSESIDIQTPGCDAEDRIRRGERFLGTKWWIGETKLFLFLNGDNFEVSFGIEYCSVDLEPLEDAEEERLNLAKL